MVGLVLYLMLGRMYAEASVARVKSRGHKVIARLHEKKHHAVVIAEGFEFHVFATYVLPILSDPIAQVAHITHAEFLVRIVRY